MINVTNKKCIYKNCIKGPNFNYVNIGKGIYCFKHKLDKMIEVKCKKSIYTDCNKRPTFN